MTIPKSLLPVSAPAPRTGKSCQACFKNKERCVIVSANEPCRKCLSLGRSCLPRKQKRMGRRPKLGTFAHGSSSIMVLDEVSTCVVVTRANASTPLKLACATHDMLAKPCIFTLPPVNSGFPEIDAVLLEPDAFFDLHKRFMLGRNFTTAFLSCVRTLVSHAPERLRMGYSAVSCIVKDYQNGRLQLDQIDTRLGSSCMQYLCRDPSTITCIKDAASILMLGQILLVYNSFLFISSSQVINQAALLMAKDWYPAMVHQPQWNSATLAPVLSDTLDCLVRGKIPIVRLPELKQPVVDRFLGLCYPLMPLLFDLCELVFNSKTQKRTPQQCLDLDMYAELSCKIQSWFPSLPPDFFIRFQPTETRAMLAQARLYPTSALLFIHRLLYPLGKMDEEAKRLATIIFDELDLLSAPPMDSPMGLGLDFPLLVGSMEFPERGCALSQGFEPIRLRQHGAKGLAYFVKDVRRMYRQGYSGVWPDLVEGRLGDVLFP